MEQYFYFYFDNNNQLLCLNSYNGHQRTLDHRETKQKLDYVDSLIYEKVVINNDKLSLIKDDTSVVIDGISKFYSFNYDYNMQRTLRNLKIHTRFRLAKKNDFKLKEKLSFLSYPKRLKIALRAGTLVALSSSFFIMTAFTNNLPDPDLQADNIVYDSTLVDEVVENEIVEYEETPEEVEEIIEEVEENYEDFDGYTDDTALAYDNYYDIVKEESERWGVDPNLVMAMLLQESHGKKANLMQVSYSAWNGAKVKLYDFVDNKYVEILVTNNKEKESENVICISSDDFNDPRGNIRLACAILRHSTERMNNNILAGLQNYNFGDGNMDCVIRHATTDLNVTKEELLIDQNNLDFANYVNFASGGDKHYIQNVLQYVKDTDELYYLDVNQYGNIDEYRCNVSDLTKTK